MQSVKEKWNRIYARSAGVPVVTAVLAENAFLLPPSGQALDLACGLGANALFLARSGLAVSAWDIAEDAIAKLAAAAERQGLALRAEVKAIDAQAFAEQQFDVIVVSRFLVRELGPAICNALAPGGLLFYQTYTQAKVSPVGPSNPAFLLQPAELVQLFSPLQLLYFRDNGLQGDCTQGLRNEAQYIGKRL